MINVLSQCTLVILKFYQEKSQQVIDFIRENPYQAQVLFETIRIDVHNISKVLESLDDSIELFDQSDTNDLYEYINRLKQGRDTMKEFLTELEHIVAQEEGKNGLDGLDFGKFNLENNDSGAA